MITIDPITHKEIQSQVATRVFLFEFYWGTWNPATQRYEDDEGNEAVPKYYTDYSAIIIEDGKEYQPETIECGNIKKDSKGKVNNLSVTVGNKNGVIQDLHREYDLINKKVVVREVILGTPDILDTTYKTRSITFTNKLATFTLSIGFDSVKAKLPRRVISANFCSWEYKGINCKYAGPDETCDKTWKDCKSKGNTINFGGFPAVVEARYVYYS